MKKDKEFPLINYLRRDILPTIFCSGCGGGTVLNVYLHALEELQIDPHQIVMVTGIGCSSWIPSPYFKSDTLHTTHGRAIAFATGVKIMRPEAKVIIIAGDGDLAAIGGNHLIHAARRNIGLTVFLVNNQIYGMTGGQVSPTTPFGAFTTTTPFGNCEPPFRIAELIAAAGACYVARWTTLHVNRLKKSMKKAIAKKGFSFVEIISQCPTSLGRRIGLKTAKDFLHYYKKQSINIAQASNMSPEQLEEKIVVGELVDREDREFTERLREMNQQIKEKQKLSS